MRLNSWRLRQTLSAAGTLLTAILAMVASVPTSAGAQAADPASVVRAYTVAVNAGDVEAAVALFTENARAYSVLTGGTEFLGKDQIRDWLTIIVNDHLFQIIDEPEVEGNRVIVMNRVWSDQWRSLGVAPLRNRLDYTVENGRITNFEAQISAESLPGVQDATAKRAVVQALFDALNAANLDGVLAQLDPAVVIEGAQGDLIRGIDGARQYYSRLIGTHIRLTPFGEWYVQSDRVVATYGLAADNLRDAGIARGETWGEFHVWNGKITHIEAKFTPNTADALDAARRDGRL